MIYLRYLWSLLRHKWFVFVAGVRLDGIPLWRLVVHDWSKFLPSEFLPYARNFYGDYSKSPRDREQVSADFDRAWLHHIHHNPHHWQHWLLVNDEDGTYPLPMARSYAREMVADWMGAGRAYTGSWDMSEWLEKNLARYAAQWHRETLNHALQALFEAGYMEIAMRGLWDE